MTYRELDTVPPYEIARWEDGKVVNAPEAIKWGRKDGLPPPAIGSKIFVLINNCGPASVTGYFVENGWLGLRCRLTNPPGWHVRQNKGNPNGHVFGPEFRLPAEARSAASISMWTMIALEISDRRHGIGVCFHSRRPHSDQDKGAPPRRREGKGRKGKAGCRMPAGRVKGKASPAARPLTRPDGEAAAGRGQEGLKRMAASRR